MSALKLYEIAEQYRELERLAESGDVPAEVLRDTLEGLTGDIEAKSVAVAKFVGNLEASADAIDAAVKAMKERAQRVRNRAESIRSYLHFNMQACGITKIECPEFVIQRKQNPPAVKIAEHATVPLEFMVQEPAPPPRPDKKKLLAALKAGTNIEGVYLEQGERLEIKS